MARLGRGGAELWKNRMRGEVSNLLSLLQLASTLTWPTVERLGTDGRVAASLPSGGCVACCSPSMFQFLPEPLSLELKIAKDGSARTRCPSLPWSRVSATWSERGLQGGRFEEPASLKIYPFLPP